MTKMSNSYKIFSFALINVLIILLCSADNILATADENAGGDKGTASPEDGDENVCLLYSAKDFKGSPILSVSPTVKVFETNLLFHGDDDDADTVKNNSSSKTVKGLVIQSVKLTKDNCSVILCNGKHLEGDCIQLSENKTDISNESAGAVVSKSVRSIDCHCSFINAESIVSFTPKTAVPGSNGKLLQSDENVEGYPLQNVPASTSTSACATLFREWHYQGQSFTLDFAGSAGKVDLGSSSRVRSMQVKEGCAVRLWTDDKLHTFSTSSSISFFPTTPQRASTSDDNFEWACCSCDRCSETVCQNAQTALLAASRSQHEDFSQFLKYGKKIIGIGRNYRWKTKELAKLLAIPSQPIVFLKPTTSYIKEGELIKLPKSLGTIFYELELGVVIGKKGKDIPEEQALDYVAGYFLALDMTAKEFIKRNQSLPWEIGKGFDAACPVGNFIPKSMVPDPNNILLECKVNGKVTQKESTSGMIFNVQQLIAYVSKYMTLQPYDTILTGTPDGFGPLRNGDVVEGRMGNLTSIQFMAVDGAEK